MKLLLGILLLAICTAATGDYAEVDYYPKLFPNNYGKGYPPPYFNTESLNNAVKETESTLNLQQEYENQVIGQGGYLPLERTVPTTRHQLHHISKPSYLFQSERFDGFLEVLSQRLKSNLNLKYDDVCYGLPKVPLDYLKNQNIPVAQWCEERLKVNCSANSPYRSLDGTCNNLNYPTWGRSFSCFQRLLPPAYGDDVSSPRVSRDGSPLPNTRTISTTLHNYAEKAGGAYTHMLVQWGQFMDHDFTFTKPFLCGRRHVINCCPSYRNESYRHPSSGPENHPQCLPIQIPNNDYYYSTTGQTCINFVRSASCSSCTLGPRQQTNQVTSVLDGSSIYGSSKKELNPLRDPNDPALLLLSATGFGALLPNSRDPYSDQCSRPNVGQYCFSAGDVRGNQHPGLMAMQTVFARYHNIIAYRLKDVNPHWSPEQVFQETRRIVVAQIQFIAYREYIHLVIGPTMMNYFDLWPHKTGRTKYDPRVNPTLFNEFAAAAYRYGHTLVNEDWWEIGPEGSKTGSYKLRDSYFDPTLIRNGTLDAIINGLCRQPAQAFDQHIVQDLTNFIYQVRGLSHGLDLAAINNQRSRDHGLRGYTSYLKYCFDTDIRTFEDLRPFISDSGIAKLKSVYRYVEDIDLWSGGLYEYRQRMSIVGPTFGCIIGLQYYNSKFGDRFFVEHGNEAGSFTDNQLQEIRKTWLSKILCLTLDFFKKVQVDVFQPISSENPEMSCDDIQDIDINHWKDTPSY